MPPAGSTSPLPAAGLGGAADLTQRLDALDRLYETQQITASELGEARRRILAGDSSPQAPPTFAAPPAMPGGGGGGAVPPTQVGSPSLAPKPPEEKKLAGLPVGVAAAIAAVVVVGAIAIALALILGGGDDDASASGPGAAGAEYLTSDVGLSLNQLTNSAVAMGKSLGRVSEPNELRALNRNAERQLDLVEEARRRLSGVAVSTDQADAHKRLITATAMHRRYLVQMGRASAGTPTNANLRALDRARKAGADTLRAYKAFFAAVPAAPDAITATDLTDVAGVRSAIRTSITQRAAREQARRSAAAQRAATPAAPARPSVYGGSSFQSPTGNLRCQNNGSDLFCSSSNDGFGVWLPAYGTPSTGRGQAAGGQTVPYGSTWSSGSFTCNSAWDGITCRNGSGNGFFLNRDTYRAF